MPTLHLFDFDGTLFGSPEQPPWWTTPDWWLRPDGLLPPLVPEQPDETWWNRDVVAAVERVGRSDISCLLTGRTEISEQRIRALLDQVGLGFDLYFFKPASSEEDTAVWKSREISSVLSKAPDLKRVVLWDDRKENRTALKAAVQRLGRIFVPVAVKSLAHSLDGTEVEYMAKPRHLSARLTHRCQSCGKELPGMPGDENVPDGISHGSCETCTSADMAKLDAISSMVLRQFWHHYLTTVPNPQRANVEELLETVQHSSEAHLALEDLKKSRGLTYVIDLAERVLSSRRRGSAVMSKQVPKLFVASAEAVADVFGLSTVTTEKVGFSYENQHWVVSHRGQRVVSPLRTSEVYAIYQASRRPRPKAPRAETSDLALALLREAGVSAEERKTLLQAAVKQLQAVDFGQGPDSGIPYLEKARALVLEAGVEPVDIEQAIRTWADDPDQAQGFIHGPSNRGSGKGALADLLEAIEQLKQGSET
jgi:hypothetical protein